MTEGRPRAYVAHPLTTYGSEWAAECGPGWPLRLGVKWAPWRPTPRGEANTTVVTPGFIFLRAINQRFP